MFICLFIHRRQAKREPKDLPGPKLDFGRDCLVGSKKLCCPSSVGDASSSSSNGTTTNDVKAKESVAEGRSRGNFRRSTDAQPAQLPVEQTPSTSEMTPSVTASSTGSTAPGVFHVNFKRLRKNIYIA